MDFKNELNQDNEKMYSCAICGKKYKHLEDRVSCESTCLKKRKEDEEKAKQEELENTRKKRLDEVNAAYEKYVSLLKAFVNDYKFYNYATTDTNSANAADFIKWFLN